MLQKYSKIIKQIGGCYIANQKIKLQSWDSKPYQFSPFVFTVEVGNRAKVMQYLADKGIDTRAYFPCIHLQKPYRDMGYHEGMYPIAEEVASRPLALPFWSDITESEVDYVCNCLKESLKD